MNRIYHNYKLWEDYKAGFYNNCSGDEKEDKVKSVLEMFNSEALTRKFMNKVIDKWYYSCDQNLTNRSVNRIAYIGQAACCIYAKVPNLITMYSWRLLSEEVRKRSDLIAIQIIEKWEQKKILEIMSVNGKVMDTQMEYQMKLPFS